MSQTTVKIEQTCNGLVVFRVRAIEGNNFIGGYFSSFNNAVSFCRNNEYLIVNELGLDYHPSKDQKPVKPSISIINMNALNKYYRKVKA